MPETQDARFGPAVRARRAELGITLDQLAEASGISRGTLSRIENNALSTSLVNALAIASALSVDLGDLLAGAETTLTTAGEATRFTDASGVVRTALARPAPGVELLAFEIPAGATSAEFAPHRPRTREVLHVLAGRLVYEVADTEHRLSTGDTLTARADHPHRLHNPGGTTCVLHMLTVSPR